MNTKNKKFYDAPQTEILEVKAEGVVCTSGVLNSNDPFTDGGDPL